MAKLTFYYGTMNSGKSMDLLKTNYNYRSQGMDTILITSALDYREGVGKISSRIGIEADAHTVSPEEKVADKIGQELMDKVIHCVLVDEAQFLTRSQVKELKHIAVNLDIPVICYGLKNDFQNNLFEGSESLLIYAEEIKEIVTVCPYCGDKAVMNLRLSEEGKGVGDGEQIVIGGNDMYVPVCHKHYNALLKGD